MAISRYRSLRTIDKKFFETMDFPSKKDLDSIETFRVRAANFDRLDNLAFKHLGSGEYWWVIAVMNDLKWGFSFEEGQILKIPISVEDVLRFF